MLRRRWHWRTLLGLRGELFTVEPDTPKEKLTHGERRTIQSNLLIAIVTVGAGLLSAFVIYLQFGEMAKQTKLLTDQQKQAQEDSKAAAKVTEEQLALTRNSVAALQAQAKAAQQQAGEAQSQMEAAQRQMEVSERPWVTMEAEFDPVSWDVSSGPRYLGKPETTTFINLRVRLKYFLRNIGKSPATRTYVAMQPFATEDVARWPLVPMNQACASAEREKQVGDKPENLSPGLAIFPGADPITREGGATEGFRGYDYRTITGIWLAVCIVYQAQFSPHLHHTKLWYVTHQDPAVRFPIPIQPGLPYLWQPFNNLRLYYSEAD